MFIKFQKLNPQLKEMRMRLVSVSTRILADIAKRTPNIEVISIASMKHFHFDSNIRDLAELKRLNLLYLTVNIDEQLEYVNFLANNDLPIERLGFLGRQYSPRIFTMRNLKKLFIDHINGKVLIEFMKAQTNLVRFTVVLRNFVTMQQLIEAVTYAKNITYLRFLFQTHIDISLNDYAILLGMVKGRINVHFDILNICSKVEVPKIVLEENENWITIRRETLMQRLLAKTCFITI